MKNEKFTEENADYVLSRVHQHGLPDTQDRSIRAQMMEGVPRIKPEYHSAEYAGNVMGIVHIEMNDAGNYFPNRLQLRLQQPGSQFYRQQFFSIQNFKGHGRQYDVTRQMGVNLLRGAYVLKNWLQEDKTSIYEWRGLNNADKTSAGHGYLSFEPEALDVVKKLGELPVQEKNPNDPRRTAVILSIEMGNSQAVHLDAPGSPVISVRANPAKGELDIIKGGHMISLEQLNTELSELKNQGVYIGDNPWKEGQGNELQTGIPGPQGTGANLSDDKKRQKQDQGPKQGEAGVQRSDMAPDPLKNVAIISGIGTPQQKETWLDPSNLEKIKKVLTGNQITPNPSGDSKKSLKV